MTFEKLYDYLRKKTAWMHLLLSFSWFIIVCLIGWVDYIIIEYNFDIFYVIIIIIAALFVSKWDGFASVIACGFSSIFTDVLTIKNPDIPVLLFNSIADFITFFITMLIVVELGSLIIKEKELSRTDYLTGAINKRYFVDLLAFEIYHSFRTENPFSFAYIDMDNFKRINDTKGHSTGDAVLKKFVVIANENIRKNDLVSRLGGDEFAVLFPETGVSESKMVTKRIIKKFSDEMGKNNYTVSLSVGLVTFYNKELSTDEVFKIADNAMYKAKKKGKNRIEQLIIK